MKCSKVGVPENNLKYQQNRKLNQKMRIRILDKPWFFDTLAFITGFGFNHTVNFSQHRPPKHVIIGKIKYIVYKERQYAKSK